MGNITQEIDNIKNAVYGKDVRKSIVNALETCYEDAGKSGNANMEVAQARNAYATLNERLDANDKNNKNLESKVNSLSSGSPLVASSVTEMVDRNKTYVNTSDGNWYYYNGTDWNIGGVYQAIGIANDSISPSDLKFVKRTSQLYNYYKDTVLTIYPDTSANVFYNSNASRTIVLPILGGETYTVSKRKLGTRFCLATSADYPATHVDIIDVVGDTSSTSKTEYTITTSLSAKYLAIFCANTNSDVSVEPDEILQSIMVNTGSEAQKWMPYVYMDINSNIGDNTIEKNKLNFKFLKFTDLIDNFNYTSELNFENKKAYTYDTTTRIPTWVSDSKSKTTILPIAQVGILRVSNVFDSENVSQMFFLDENGLVIQNYNLQNIMNTTSFPKTVSSKALIIYNEYSEFDCAKLYKSGCRYITITFVNTRFNDSYIYYRNAFLPKWLDLSIVKPIQTCVNMFTSVAAIGDSFTAGDTYITDESKWGNSQTSWIQTIGNRAGINWSNYGWGGSTTRSYVAGNTSGTKGLPLVLSSTANMCYFICLGINDANSLGASYIGTISDINDEDFSQNADTFYGNYGRIIQATKAHSPLARFVLLSIPRQGSQYTPFDVAIAEIAKHFEIPFINVYDDDYFTSDLFTTQDGNHPTASAYAGMGLAIERLFSKCVTENINYFLHANEVTR